MNHSHLTEAQLFKASLRNWPWFTISLALLQVTAFLIVELNPIDVAFGLNLPQSGIKRELAFDLLHPTSRGGISLITSFFTHSDESHFFSNLPWLLLFSFLLERNRSKPILLFILMTGHAAALLGAYFAMSNFGAPQWVLGTSGGTLTLALGFLYTRNRSLAGAFVLSIFLILGAIGVSTVISHLPSIFVGLFWGHFLKEKTPLRRSQKPATT